MPFIKAIEQFDSVAIVGMEKNTGKTTCLNYVMNRLYDRGARIALTSIGVDGEERDVLYDTPKPRIILHKGMIFVTSEKDFEQREFPAEILSVSTRETPLGCLITARAKDSGRVVLSGPSDSAWLQEVIAGMKAYGVGITLVDGALSRMSLASPAVTDAMILCTGAACSSHLPELIRRTKFRCRLIDLPQVPASIHNLFSPLDNGVWLLTRKNDSIRKIGETVFTANNDLQQVLSGEVGSLGDFPDSRKISAMGDIALSKEIVTSEDNTRPEDMNMSVKNATSGDIIMMKDVAKTENAAMTGKVTETGEITIYVSGAVTGRFLENLRGKVRLVVRDFSRLFVSEQNYNCFIRNGGKVEVLQKAKLLAVCTNPVSPEGVSLDPLLLREQMQEALQLPVYDILRIKS